MQQVSQPIDKHLVLIGGGHSHAIALKLSGVKPLAGVRLTLISDTSDAPYSGMLPGHIAGFYNFQECHIDLRQLAQFAGTQLLIDRAIGLDLESNQVLCASGAKVGFDLLSVDIGSTPAAISVPGAAEYAIPAKPVPKLLAGWNRIVDRRIASPGEALRLGIVGGGAGGVELALAMGSHLQQIDRDARVPVGSVAVHLFHSGDRIVPGHNSRLGRRLREILTRRGIELHLGEKVCQVQPREDRLGLGSPAVCVRCESGLAVECDRVFWVTQASPASWLREAGLATDAAGFILVGDTLQSVSHPRVFAAGDVATMVNYPRPKAGVFAVRQGKPLFENWRRVLLGLPVLPFRPQKQFLSLIGTGDRSAIASVPFLGGPFACGPSPLLWRWKDWIDRRFMEQFRELPVALPPN